MKILVDENMPYARELFSRLGEVKAVPGRPIPVEELNHADALMVRSVTKVNESLLSGTPINFVGTATAGTDHVDEAWLKQAGIGFSAAPGCNAIAVVEYVFSALLMLAERDGFSLRDCTIGIVGVGNVGSRLQTRLEALGIRTLLCNPPRAARGDEGDFRTLDELVQEADVLTFHTPLYKDGPYKTLHLADETLIRRLKPGAILINACRGPVVDNAALLARLNAGQPLSVVLDVWEGEPNLTSRYWKPWISARRILPAIRWKAKRAAPPRSLRRIARLSVASSMSRWRHYCLRLSLVVLRFMARWINRR